MELPRRLEGLDVVRGLAALAVVGSHVALSEPGAAQARGGLAWAATAFQSNLGAWGVGVFFVLSGLCIHLPLARRSGEGAGARLAPRPYFSRRFTRIYPPHLVALLLSAMVALALPADLLTRTALTRPTWTQLGLHLVMAHSFVPSAISSINAVLWTIAVETHFYLLYPLLLPLARRHGFVRLTAALFVLSVAARWVGAATTPLVATVVETNFVCRLWEWALGCCLAELLVRRGRPAFRGWGRLAVLGCGSLLAVVALKTTAQLALGGDAGRLAGNEAAALIGPLLFAVVVHQACGGPLPAAGLARAFHAQGGESYSLYLSHPISIAAWLLASSALGLPLWLTSLGCLPAALAGSWAFFRAFERPFMSRAAKVGGATVTLRG